MSGSDGLVSLKVLNNITMHNTYVNGTLVEIVIYNKRERERERERERAFYNLNNTRYKKLRNVKKYI